MSRGLGTLQRQVLAVLDRRDQTIADVTRSVYGDFTDSQRRGVARAVSTLAARGLAVTSLSATRFRESQVEHTEYRPPFFDPIDREWYGGRDVVRTDLKRVPVPETVVRLSGESAELAAAVAEDARLSR